MQRLLNSLSLPVDEDQLAQLMRAIPTVAVGATIGAAVAAYPCLADDRLRQPALVWLAIFALVSLARIGLSLAYLRGGAERAAPNTWQVWAVVGTMAHALLWGASSVTLWNAGDPLAESLLHIVLATVAMGAAVHLTGYVPLLVALVVCVIAPLVLRDLWMADTYHLLLAFMCTVVGIYAISTGRNQAKAMREVLDQRRRNARLVVSLQHEIAAANEARAAAERANAAKNRLFAAANHDLRQPLHAVGLMAHTLGTQGARADVPLLSARIGECVDGLGHLVDSMLELSQLDSGSITADPSDFKLGPLLAEVSSTYLPLATAKGLTLTCDAADICVRSDRALVARVLHNLLANAVRYTSQGHVGLYVEQLNGEAVRVRVQDTGIGIDTNELPRIYEEFYQIGNRARDRRHGLGLGLATVKRLNELLGLDLQVQSTPGQGSVFSFRLNLGDEAACRIDTTAEGASDSMAGRHVFVLEDDPPSRDALVQLLEEWSCTVRAAHDTRSALEAVAQGYRPDIILADLRLAGGDNGYDTALQVGQRLNATLPILLMSGDTGRQGFVDQAGVRLPVLRKPVKPLQLRALMTATFATAQAEQPLDTQ